MYCRQFIDKIQFQKATIVDTATGTRKTWSNDRQPLWASVKQLTDTIVDLNQNQSQPKLYKILIRRRVELDLETTRIIWKNKIFVPIMVTSLPSRSNTPFTHIVCHQIDELAQTPSGP